jgi:hypothetical protein
VYDGKVQRSKHAGARQRHDADEQKSANNAPAYETAKTHDPNKVNSARPDATLKPMAARPACRLRAHGGL